MKKLFRSFTIITLIICIVFGGSCFGCGGCFGCSGCFADAIFSDIPRGTEMDLSEEYLKRTKETFEEEKQSIAQHVNALTISISIEGYNETFVYFDCVVTVTIVCDAITESNHNGEKIQQEIIIKLDREGNGSNTKKIEFKNCYSVEVAAIKYTFSGTVVKK